MGHDPKMDAHKTLEKITKRATRRPIYSICAHCNSPLTSNFSSDMPPTLPSANPTRSYLVTDDSIGSLSTTTACPLILTPVGYVGLPDVAQAVRNDVIHTLGGVAQSTFALMEAHTITMRRRTVEERWRRRRGDVKSPWPSFSTSGGVRCSQWESDEAACVCRRSTPWRWASSHPWHNGHRGASPA